MADDIDAATEADTAGLRGLAGEQSSRPSSSAGQPQTQDQVAPPPSSLPRRGTPGVPLSRDSDTSDMQDHTNLMIINRLDRCETELQVQGAHYDELTDGFNSALDHQATLSQQLETRADENTILNERCNSLSQKLDSLTQQLDSRIPEMAALRNDIAILTQQLDSQAQETATRAHEYAVLTQKLSSQTQEVTTLNTEFRAVQALWRQRALAEEAAIQHKPATANHVNAQPPQYQPTQRYQQPLQPRYQGPPAPVDLTGSTPPTQLGWAPQPPAAPPASTEGQFLNPEAQALNEENQTLRQLLAARPSAPCPALRDQHPRGRHLQKIDKMQKPIYTNKCMGSQTRRLAEDHFVRYAQQLHLECGASEELIVQQLYECIPAYMKDEIMSYGTIASNVDDFIDMFRAYFTPNLSVFYATFTNQQGSVHLQQAHESVKDFIQTRFYQHLLHTRGIPPPESRVTSSNQQPFWHQFVQKTFQRHHWNEALHVIETLEQTNPDWNSLKTWNNFIQRFRFASASPQVSARPFDSVAEVTTPAGHPPPGTLPGGMAAPVPPSAPNGSSINASMLRVVYTDTAPPVQFSDFVRSTPPTACTDSVNQPPPPSPPQPPDSPRPRLPPPNHQLPSIAETTPEMPAGPVQAAAPCSTPASMPPALLSEDHALTVAPTSVETPLPESEETVETALPAATPASKQTRQQIPRQADPLVPDDQQRHQQLQRDAQAKLARGKAGQERQESIRRTAMRVTNQKQTKPGDNVGSTPVQLPLSDFLTLIAKAAELGIPVSGAVKVLNSFLDAPTPPDADAPVLSVEQTSIARKALDQDITDQRIATVRRDINEFWQGTSSEQPTEVSNNTRPKRRTSPEPPVQTAAQARRPTGKASRANHSDVAQVPIAAPTQQNKEVRISLTYRDPHGKILLAYNARSEKYGLPSARVPWAADLRPAVNQITSDLGMDPNLPVWNTITILGVHDAHHGPPRIELGVHTEIPGKHSAKQVHNSRFWVAGDKVINPPESLRLAHRLSRDIQKFVTAPVTAASPSKDRKPPGNRHWGNRDIPQYDVRGKPTPWQPGKSRLGATPADDSSVVTIDCTSRCGDRDIPPPPNQDTSPPIKIEGLTRAVGPTDYQDGTAVVTNGSNTTAVRIVGSDVVVPIDTGHKSSPTPPFAPGQPLRFLLRRAFITVGSATRDDFVVAYQPQPVSPVDPHAAGTEWRTVPAPDYLLPDAAIFAQAAKLGTTPTGKHHIVATTAPTHPFWVGPRDRALRLPISKLDSAAEANCISWDVYTGIRDNLEAAGCPLLTSDSVSLQGAHGNSRATIFGTVKNIPIFLHENQSDPVFVDFVVMNGNSPVLLGAPFMDDYFQLIHIECRYFAFYTTPRAVRELNSGDYSAELMKVPYVIQSRAIVLQSTASVHQVLNINASNVIDQDMPQGEASDAPTPAVQEMPQADQSDMPTLAAEDSDDDDPIPEEHTEAYLSEDLAATSLRTPPGRSSPDPNSPPCTQFTPSQERTADDLQRQVDARNAGDMPAGPSSWHETDSLSSRPPKAARQAPPAPDSARRLLFPGPQPNTLPGGMATRVTPAAPHAEIATLPGGMATGVTPETRLPDETIRANAPPTTRAPGTPDTIIGRLLANPGLHPFLAAELSPLASQLLRRAGHHPLIRQRQGEHPIQLRQIYADVLQREVHPIWDHVMNMFLPVLQLRSIDDVDPSSAINGSLELLSYALSLRYLILGNIHDDVWDDRDFEVRHYQEPIHLFRGELTAAVRAYAPFRNLVAAEDSSSDSDSDSDYYDGPQFLGATLSAHIYRSLSHIQFDPVFPATATVPQLPAHLETLLPGTHAVFRQASREFAIVDETDPFHLRFPMVLGSMPAAVVRWYREMTFLFQSEPWYSLITHPRPLPPDTMNASIRVTAEAALDRMDRRRSDYQQTYPAPPTSRPRFPGAAWQRGARLLRFRRCLRHPQRDQHHGPPDPSTIPGVLLPASLVPSRPRGHGQLHGPDRRPPHTPLPQLPTGPRHRKRRRVPGITTAGADGTKSRDLPRGTAPPDPLVLT